MSARTFTLLPVAVLSALLLAACSGGEEAEVATAPAPLVGPKLYVLDCGTIDPMDTSLFSLEADEVDGDGSFTTPCYVVRHPNGATLLWEAGQIPDSEFPEDGSPVDQGLFNGTRSLTAQLEEIGLEPGDITYFAMSHYHSDHTANANLFAGSTWIVQSAEKDAMFSEGDVTGPQNQDSYSELANSQTILLEGEDYDVFNDGSVWVKFAPGHTPGHQMLYVNLVNHGPVLLAGDLYHFPEEKELDRVPTFDWDADTTRTTRMLADIFMRDSGAEMWIQHDNAQNAALNKSPEFHD